MILIALLYILYTINEDVDIKNAIPFTDAQNDQNN